MELRQVRYFVAAYEDGSFSAAAVRLNCTAPGISQQMSALEARVGASLFERTRRGVTPTEAGRRFYLRCLAVLKAVSEAETELEDVRVGASGSIAVGFAPGVAKSILPQALARFADDYPRVDIHIASGTADALVADASSGALDFYVGQFIRPQAGLAATHIGRFPVALLSGASRGFVQLQPLRLDETPPLKLFVPSANNSLRPRIEEAIRSGELAIERCILIDSLSAGLEFLSQTDWSSILPYWIGLKALDNARLTVNPISGSDMKLDLTLIHSAQRPLSRPAQTLYDYFIEALRATELDWQRLTDPALSHS